ncbi:RcnB family protein [Novosphingobium sp. 1949]|uniref:RcnB family protein n=1 Tax=Novosphingobium organovorum TaxID=2930092 RepID=A0ABT0BF21_9SPHN|nr:RcnB family protein [Novosphingobium organovorum]MCJ2183650.1 RcnB family protein [Novosphingobium organovorum]
MHNFLPQRAARRIGLIGSVLNLLLAISPTTAHPDTVRHTTVQTDNGVYRRTVVVDRGRPGWWHDHPGFVHYNGPRAGYYFAPGYGYYRVPPAYVHTTWVVGRTLPVDLRGYVVVSPAGYGLAPPSPGYGWYFVGTNFVLIRKSSGVIVQSVAGGW